LSDIVSEESGRKLWEVTERSEFKPVNVDMDDIQAKIIVRYLETFGRIEQLITIAEGRRNATLREIERRHVAPARMVQEKIREIENAEYEVVAANPAHKKAA
jgi:hypothetical protein